MTGRNIAVVLAGGTGSRVGGPLPKQFVRVGGRAVVEYSIDTFCAHEAIDEVAVVVHPQWRAEMLGIAERRRWAKLGRVIDGGEERYVSSLNAVAAYADSGADTNLLMHDAARPLVSAAVIGRVTDALREHEAVGVAVPSTDTVWQVGEDGAVEAIPLRGRMWMAQTPQAFRLGVLREAYGRAVRDGGLRATDDCGVVRRYMPGVRIAVVEGEAVNFKITYASDLQRLRALADCDMN